MAARANNARATIGADGDGAVAAVPASIQRSLASANVSQVHLRGTLILAAATRCWTPGHRGGVDGGAAVMNCSAAQSGFVRKAGHAATRRRFSRLPCGTLMASEGQDQESPAGGARQCARIETEKSGKPGKAVPGTRPGRAHARVGIEPRKFHACWHLARRQQGLAAVTDSRRNGAQPVAPSTSSRFGSGVLGAARLCRRGCHCRTSAS